MAEVDVAQAEPLEVLARYANRPQMGPKPITEVAQFDCAIQSPMPQFHGHQPALA